MLRAPRRAATNQVLTGVAVAAAGRAVTPRSTTTDVTFAALTDAEIDWYVATGEPLDKAGAYGIQGAGGLFVTRIDGSHHNVVGLPLARPARAASPRSASTSVAWGPPDRD